MTSFSLISPLTKKLAGHFFNKVSLKEEICWGMFNFLREKISCVNKAFSKRSLIKTKRELERCDRSTKLRIVSHNSTHSSCQIFVSFVALLWNVRYHSPPPKKLLYKETRQIVCLIRLKVMSRYCWWKENFCCWPNAPGFLCMTYRSYTWIPEPIFSSWYVPRNTYQSWTLCESFKGTMTLNTVN